MFSEAINSDEIFYAGINSNNFATESFTLKILFTELVCFLEAFYSDDVVRRAITFKV